MNKAKFFFEINYLKFKLLFFSPLVYLYIYIWVLLLLLCFEFTNYLRAQFQFYEFHLEFDFFFVSLVNLKLFNFDLKSKHHSRLINFFEYTICAVKKKLKLRYVYSVMRYFVCL